MLDREETIEQAYFFRSLREGLEMQLPMQELLLNLREEVLASTKLPLAIDFLHTELIQLGLVGPAMKQLNHYFTPFQTYVIKEAERDDGRFDLRVGLQILERDAAYRSEAATRPGAFLFQFETICRNRLGYDQGLAASAEDPIFDEEWKTWILELRHQIGVRDLAELVFRRSQFFVTHCERKGHPIENPQPILFGEKEGRIAFANRGKDPLLLLSALQRHLSYPAVPRPEPIDNTGEMIPQMSRRIERLESRLKLLEDEQRDGIDITRFYQPPEDN